MAARYFHMASDSKDRPDPSVKVGPYRCVFGSFIPGYGTIASELVAERAIVVNGEHPVLPVEFDLWYGDTPEEVADAIRDAVLNGFEKYEAGLEAKRATGVDFVCSER